MDTRVEELALGLGGLVCALLFFVCLPAIIVLGAQLTISNMMYVCLAAYRRHITASRAAILLAVCTVLNVVGAFLLGFALSQSQVFADMDPSRLGSSIVAHNLDKSPVGLVLEGMIATFGMNLVVIACLLLKDATATLFTLIYVIAFLVGLGTEPVIARFFSEVDCWICCRSLTRTVCARFGCAKLGGRGMDWESPRCRCAHGCWLRLAR